MANRIEKVLEDANIKLTAVASDVLGASGRDMIAALIAGGEDPERLADLARQRLRAKIPQLRQALHGRVTEHHRFQLRMLMEQVAHLDRQVGRYGDRIAEVMGRPGGEAAGPGAGGDGPGGAEAAGPPAAGEAARRLATVPGVGERSAAGDRGGDRHGHDGVRHGGPPGVVGRGLPGQRRQRRAEAERQDDQGERVAEDDAGAGGVGGQPHQGDDAVGGVPALGQATGSEEGAGGVGP